MMMHTYISVPFIIIIIVIIIIIIIIIIVTQKKHIFGTLKANNYEHLLVAAIKKCISCR